MTFTLIWVVLGGERADAILNVVSILQTEVCYIDISVGLILYVFAIFE